MVFLLKHSDDFITCKTKWNKPEKSGLVLLLMMMLLFSFVLIKCFASASLHCTMFSIYIIQIRYSVGFVHGFFSVSSPFYTLFFQYISFCLFAFSFLSNLFLLPCLRQVFFPHYYMLYNLRKDVGFSCYRAFPLLFLFYLIAYIWWLNMKSSDERIYRMLYGWIALNTIECLFAIHYLDCSEYIFINIHSNTNYSVIPSLPTKFTSSFT